MKMLFVTSGIEFDGATMYERGLGGSETALCYMALSMAELGHDVAVWCRCPRPGTYSDVVYNDLEALGDDDVPGDYDVAFVYRYAPIALKIKASRKILVCHDMPVPDIVGWIQEYIWAFHEIFFLSEYHRAEYCKEVPGIGRRAWVTANGIDLALTESRLTLEKENYVIWGSRPERGLDILLERIQPRLKSELGLDLMLGGYVSVPEPRLASFYERCRNKAREVGAIDKGPLSKPKWMDAVAKAKLVVYPCRYQEIFCIIALEAMAVGTPIVTTDDFALKELVLLDLRVSGDPESITYVDKFVEKVRWLVKDDEAYASLRHSGIDRAKPYSWKRLARKWELRVKEILDREEPTQTLSVCMIIKNEILNVDRAVRYGIELGDDLIICDSGSTDGTLLKLREAEAKNHGVVVKQISPDPDGDGMFNFGWAREECRKIATGDWIFWFDADEQPIGKSRIRKYLNNWAYDGYRIEQINFSLSQGVHVNEQPIRLFRNTPDVRFAGVIHEGPVFKEDQGELPLLKDFKVAHFGYVDPWENLKTFEERNAALLAKDIKMFPERPVRTILEIRDLHNRVNVALKVGGNSVTTLLLDIVNLWRREFEMQPGRSFRDRAYASYQFALTTLRELSVESNEVDPFEVEWLMVVGKGALSTQQRQPQRMWFSGMKEFSRFVEAKTEEVAQGRMNMKRGS